MVVDNTLHLSGKIEVFFAHIAARWRVKRSDPETIKLHSRVTMCFQEAVVSPDDKLNLRRRESIKLP